MIKNCDWPGAFFCAAIIQGALVFLATLYYFVYGSLYMSPSPSMVVASGSAGIWLLFGYLLLVIMTLYQAATSYFYYYIEKAMKKNFSKKTEFLSWAHIILVNFGMVGAAFLLMNGGYTGGSALLPTAVGGGGLTQGQVHVQILAPYPPYVIAFVVITMLGVLCGGLSYLLTIKKKQEFRF